MDSDRTRLAHSIFARAMEVPDGEREAYVRAQCEGDADVLALVSSLLGSVDRLEGFLEQPPAPAMGAPIADEPAPDAVGDYLITGVLGAGGMATVYEAIQDQPKRRVALKVMHQSMADEEARQRFAFETETLARLVHPGIARIYEAGSAPLGGPSLSPFFAMELIEDASPITEYAEANGLGLRARLSMFLDVCDAVRFGHQNGVIHRDIKPGNVLVGADGAPRVIDFGIARASRAGADSITIATDASRLIGTLNYMSPEQCNAPSEIDIRSDVYSLGVLLYQLVTGVLPHDLKGRSIPEAVRCISEDTPVRAGTHRPSAAGDLDAIIAQAIEKDRTLRYGSAWALAEDIRRHLGNRPVQARHAGALYQLRKFAARNRSLTAAAAIALVSLLVGLGLTARAAQVANRALAEAEQRASELETVTAYQESLLSGIDAREMGEQLRLALEQAAGEHGSEALLGEETNFTSVALGLIDESILQRSHASINTQFSDEPALRGRMLQRLATTMHTLGLHKAAMPVLHDAYDVRRAHLGEDHPDTLQSMQALGSLHSVLGEYEQACSMLEDALERSRRTLGPEHRATLRIGTTLGGALRRMGDRAGAERVWKETLEGQRRALGPSDPETLRTLNNVGIIYAMEGRLDEAAEAWREVIEQRRKDAGVDSPEYLGTLGNLGVLLTDMGRYDEAMPLVEEALGANRRRLGDLHTSTLQSMTALADLLLETGDLVGAEALYLECLEGRRAALGPTHGSTLLSEASYASVRHRLGHSREAEAALRRALAQQREHVGADHPETLASIDLLIGMRHDLGDLDGAIALSTEVIELSLGALPPRHWALGARMSLYGELLLDAGDHAGAEQPLRDGHEFLLESLGATHPLTVTAAERLARYSSLQKAAPP